jgi:hypothetical protein
LALDDAVALVSAAETVEPSLWWPLDHLHRPDDHEPASRPSLFLSFFLSFFFFFFLMPIISLPAGKYTGPREDASQLEK